ncbi:MAG: MATE family efflux transporter [Erysipelotrichaceae bacterium]|nr:MATE family efflux transporter [Erysipelotrichaceae bacterium]
MKNEYTIVKQLFIELWPAQFFSVITSGLSAIINGLIVGNYLDVASMAAIGLATPLSKVFSATSVIVAGGARILCGRCLGRGEVDKINKIFTIAIKIITVLGIIFTAVCLLFSTPLASLFGAAGETIETTSTYIRGLAVGIVPTLVIPVLMVFLQMGNESKMAFVGTLLIAILNCIFGLINVFVIKGGVFGVGLASSISVYLALLFIAFLFIKKDNLMKYEKHISLDLSLIKTIAILGFPSALTELLYATRNTVINNVATSIDGTKAAAALSVMGSSSLPFDAVAIGLGGVVAMLSSVAYGEQDKTSLKTLFKFAFIFGEALTLIRIILYFGCAKYIAIIFGTQADLIDYVATLLRYYAVAMPLNILPVVITNTYQSLGKVKLDNVLLVFTCIIFPLSTVYIFSSFMGINGVWSCYYVAEICITLLIMLICTFKNKKIPTSIEDILMLDNNFGIKDEDKIAITINTINEVTNISEKVTNFALAKGADKKRSNMCGLCIEEMAANIVEHGFTKGKQNKKYVIDVFVMYKDEQFTIRLKDNCVPFDPHTKLKMYNPEDPCKNIGIRMVSKIAKTMNYQSTFGMNVLTITL